MMMNVRLEVSVIPTPHVTILTHHTVVNVTKVLLEMEQIAQVYNILFAWHSKFLL